MWEPGSARNIQAAEQRSSARFVTSRYIRDDSQTAMFAELEWFSLSPSTDDVLEPTTLLTYMYLQLISCQYNHHQLTR